MLSDWQNFLMQRGATIESGIVRHFGDAAAELDATAHASILCDLGQLGTLRVSGDDAQSFLQNLLSNDVREVNATQAQYTSLSSAKGRMLAVLLIRRDGDDYLVQLPRPLCEQVRKKFGMYVLRAKVRISDASDEIVTLGLSGPDATSIIQSQFGEPPLNRLDITTYTTDTDKKDELPISVLKLGDTRFQIATSPQQAQVLWDAMSDMARPVGSLCWDWLDIRAGIPAVLPQTQEQFVAQMANLDLIGGISFNKGCYPGQEIVARTQYLGKLKRRTYLAHVTTDIAPQPGNELFSADMEGQPSGMVVNAAPAPGGGYDLLAVVQIASHDAFPVHLDSLTGHRLEFQPLPYPLP